MLEVHQHKDNKTLATFVELLSLSILVDLLQISDYHISRHWSLSILSENIKTEFLWYIQEV